MHSFRADERGNMAMLFALAFSLVGVAAAISVDSAALYHERRALQAAVDLAALSAASRPAEAEAIATAVLAEAGFADASLVVTPGRYEPDPSRAPEDRFLPDARPTNAVAVSAERLGQIYFGASMGEAPMIGARGLAMVEPQVSFSLGSGLASLNNGIANQLLGQLLGTTVSLSLVQYTALASARVDALEFLDALAFEMGVTALTYDDLLEADAQAGQIAGALASVLNGVERAALTTLAAAGPGQRVPLDKLFDLGPLGRLTLDGESTALGADLSVLDILSASAMLADGSRQAGLTLGAGLPGIASISVSLTVGEPAQGSGWFAFGPEGKVLRTAQVRMRLDVKLLGNLKGNLIHLPVWVDLAHAEAEVASVSCPGEESPSGDVEIAVLPSVARLAIGQVSDAQLRNFAVPLTVTPATLVDVLLLRLIVSAHVEVRQATPISLSFTSDDIETGAKKTARTTGLATSLTQSLFGSLTVSAPILGGLLGLSLTGVTQALLGLLTPVTAPLDAVLDALLSALGLGIGEADVRVYGVSCAQPVLVG